jgi:hypothetical protein
MERPIPPAARAVCACPVTPALHAAVRSIPQYPPRAVAVVAVCVCSAPSHVRGTAAVSVTVLMRAHLQRALSRDGAWVSPFAYLSLTTGASIVGSAARAGHRDERPWRNASRRAPSEFIGPGSGKMRIVKRARHRGVNLYAIHDGQS